MTGGRSPGRYNLHRLGWTAFEDLCMQIMRVVLGEVATRFRPGPDGGRDGWFQGVATGRLVTESTLSGAFVVQCKHTSSTHEPLDVSDLRKEFEKVKKIALASPCHYVLMTNRQVSAQAEARIRQFFESLPGVGRCLVLSETWIEDTIDAHPRLLRLVPRLYGIGDLSQIVAFVMQEQTRAVLDDLAAPLRTFVPTDSYRRAEKALHDHGFVVLVGPPASGKSAIAANLCMVSIAQDANVRVLRIEHAEQFKSTWSPSDSNTIYWVDDVFGETTLDEERLREWSAAIEKVEAARRRKARILFCTRDYILASAERKLKRSKLEIINDARVRVDVAKLSEMERDAILYNHIKEGDIAREQKRALKKHLSALARLRSFSPELARRLGNKRFHSGLRHELKELEAFFERPVQHFRDVIHGLSRSETAALAVCLHSGNALPDPVSEGEAIDAVLEAYGVSIHEIRESLEALEGSLVKRARQATSQTWQLHHPSMLEALQEELAARSAKLTLYLQSADLHTVLRDTTTLPPSPESRMVFVPDAAYDHLVLRLHRASARSIEGIAGYLADKASSAFLRAVDAVGASLIDRALAVVPYPEGTDVAASLAARLSLEEGLFHGHRQSIVRSTLQEAASDTGWCGFLDEDELREALPGFNEEFIAEEAESGFASIERIYEWYREGASTVGHVDNAVDAIESHCRRLRNEISKSAFPPNRVDQLQADVNALRDNMSQRLAERRFEIEENDERRAEYNADEWKERYYEERYELEQSIFADVDE
ncbi:restriction endonuclease [Corallococcus sicarius]|nr:restriction endonuclease [Corallococcus sicarius]